MHPKQANTLFPVAKAGSFMHPFFHKQRIWMQRPRIKGKILHPETKETDVLVAMKCECRKNPGAGICSSGSRVCNQVRVLSEALLAHGVGNLLEAGDVRTLDVVDVSVRALAFLDAAVVDVLHDDMEFLVHFLC